MIGVSLSVWVRWRFWTMVKKREGNSLIRFYIRNWKRVGVILPKSWRKMWSVGSKPICWMSKTQRRPRYLMTLHEFRSVKSNGEMTKSRSYVRKFECLYSFNHGCIGKSKFYFFSLDKREKLKFWGVIVGAKARICTLSLKPYSLMGMRPRKSKWLGRP